MEDPTGMKQVVLQGQDLVGGRGGQVIEGPWCLVGHWFVCLLSWLELYQCTGQYVVSDVIRGQLIVQLVYYVSKVYTEYTPDFLFPVPQRKTPLFSHCTFFHKY